MVVTNSTPFWGGLSYIVVTMDKRTLLLQLIDKINTELEVIRKSAEIAHDDATHEESRAENKYDTRGLESSYLAGAQMERVRILTSSLKQIEGIQLKKFSDNTEIAATAVIELEDLESKKHTIISCYQAVVVLALS